jgi:hypothetical protein
LSAYQSFARRHWGDGVAVRPAATEGEKERPDGDCETEQSDCSLQHLNRPPLLEFFGFFEVIPDAPLPLRPEQPIFAVAAVSLFFSSTRLSSFASLLSF